MKDPAETTRQKTAASAPHPFGQADKYSAATFELLPVVVAFLDVDLRFRFINREFEKWYRVTRDEAIGKRADEVFPRKTFLKLERHIDKARHGQASQFVGSVAYPDGITRRVRVELIPSHESDGAIDGIVGIATDLSREWAFERDLIASRASLARAQRVARLGSWDWNVVTNDLRWSDEIYRIFGLVPQQFGASYPAFLERVHPDDQPLVVAAVSRSLEAGDPYRIDHRIVLPSGEVRTVHEYGEVTYSRSGRPLRMTGTVIDVTEQRANEEALARHRTMLAGILNISPEAIIVAGPDFRVLMFSSGAEAVFGYTAGEMVGERIECLIPDRFRKEHGHHVAAFLESTDLSVRMDERREIIGLRKSGEEFPAEASISKLETKDGNVVTVILRDITQRKAVQEALVTAKLTAEAASHAKSVFLANMSHELRTPLNAVIGFSEMLANEIWGPLGNPKYLDYAADILGSGRHLLDIINDILDISRLDLGKIQLNDDTVPINGLIQECERMLQPKVKDSGLHLLAIADSALPPVRADRRLIKQVLLNLLSNSVKFTPRGGRIEIAGSRAADGGIEILVRDNGIGMSQEEVMRLGKPFTQFDEGLSRRFEGAGLGFSIAKGLVELHGGAITVVSALGEGTTVTVRLPAERVVAFETRVSSILRREP